MLSKMSGYQKPLLQNTHHIGGAFKNMISDKKILTDSQDSFFKTSYNEEFSPPNDFKKYTYK
jgi:hypothetical protein